MRRPPSRQRDTASGAADRAADAGERFFKELADFAPVMIWRSGRDALCDWFNKPWLDFVGRTMEQEVGNGWAENVHPDDFDRCLKTYVSSFEARKPFTMSYRLKRHDGAYREILDNGSAYYRDGQFAGYFGSCIDISDRTAAEARLRQAQKMEAIGQLTGGVAHDFNNILQVIGGSLQLLSKGIAVDERGQRHLRNALEAVTRGAKLATQLLTFARRQTLDPKAINVSRVIRGMDDLLRRALGEAVEIETILGGGLWTTYVDPTQVETALLNLAVNARDAMDGRGKLTIEAGNAWLDDHYAAQHPEVRAGQYVMVAVSDTGHGMTPDVMERVFEPFFTTKAAGQGTGLGLSMVHGFVKQSGGHIKIYSEIGRGTTVRLYLPRSDLREQESDPITSAAVEGGTETILLVEDDDKVRATTADLLDELGYRVLKAREADSATAIIESGASIDLLLTDVVLPGALDARELARRAQERLPRLRVLFTSGYTDNAIIHGKRLDPGVEMLSKPFTQEELARKLRKILTSKDTKGAG
ncbi:MAG TPA: ATP-binding protein [Xanthobacteraceae bacterium]|nr:ATP-binding protein [Xanthobacteraceae bacterium]